MVNKVDPNCGAAGGPVRRPSLAKLGRSDVAVGPLVFGGSPIAGLYSPVTEEDAQQCLAAAWEDGIRAFDTAPHYGAGLSEERLGAFLRERKRDEYVVSTKVGRLLVAAENVPDGSEGFFGSRSRIRMRDYSRDGVVRSVEDSLARLSLERVDILLVHDPDDYVEVALRETLPALEELRSQGLVRAIGIGVNDTALAEHFVRPLL